MTSTLILLTLIFPFLYKYSFVITNQFTQIPIILSFLDPNYLPNDWYVSVSRTFGPRTIFAWYMAQTARIFPLPLSFFLHYLLYIFLIIYSSYKLAYLIFNDKFIAATTTICILFGSSITLGGNILVTPDFTAPQLPLGLTLLGVVFLLEKKFFLSSLLFTVSSYLHPLIGFESAALFFITLLLVFTSIKEKVIPFLKNWVLPYAILASPILFLYAKEASRSNIASIDKINILAYMRNPHHYVASLWSVSFFVQFTIFFLIFLIFLFSLKKIIKPLFFKFIALSVLLILVSCLVGYLGVEIFHSYPLTVLQTYRLTLYLYWLSAVILFGGSIYFLSQPKIKSCYTNLFLIPVFLSNLQTLEPSGKTYCLAMVIGILLIVFFQKIQKKLFIFSLIVFFSLFRYHQKFNFSSYAIYPTQETEIALWVKNNTPVDSIFLIPPEFESFRLVTNRAIVADWKAFPFQEKAMLEWANRMCDIANITNCSYRYLSKQDIISSYRTHTKHTLANLAKNYHIDYIITDQDIPTLTKIYSNTYSVYKL